MTGREVLRRRNGAGAATAAAGGSGTVPEACKKMVQSMKEIVNCSEMEIYAMLKECNMDPSEAVHRLLSQDTFHEVKSKRDRKKETKETLESRPRALISSSTRGLKGGNDRGGRMSSTQSSSNDYGVSRGKPPLKKENGISTVPSYPVVGYKFAGNNLNRGSAIQCEAVSMANTTHATVIAEGISLPSQPSSGFQNNWSRMPGQVSMADIVKMGRPQGKPSSIFTVASDTLMPNNQIMSNVPQHGAKISASTVLPSESDQEFHTSEGPLLQNEEISHVPITATGQQGSRDDWSQVDETPAENEPTHTETSGYDTIYADPSTSSTLPIEENFHLNSHSDENQVLAGDVNGESPPTESVRSSITERHIDSDNSGVSSHLDDGSLEGMSSYESQRHAFEQCEVGDVNGEISSAGSKLQQLSLHKEDSRTPDAENNPAVIIPRHLQVTNADCSHLSFGSFGSNISVPFSGSFPPKPLKNLEVASVVDDAPSLDQSNSRHSEYYDDGPLKSTLNENTSARNGTSTRSFDMPSASQSEVIGEDTTDAIHGFQGNFSSVPGYAFSATTQPTAAAYAYPETNSQMQSLAPFSSLMQPYTNSLPNSLLSSTVQPLREFDLPFPGFLTTQSMPTKYSTVPSSISASTISMPEVRPGVFSSPQPTPEILPTTSIPTGGNGPALPQHLPIHPYSQPTLPLGHFANMISYPFLPQSYAFLPSAAYQQAYAGNSPFHQSPAAGIKYASLPQYKSNVSVTSLPQSPALPAGYGGFSGSANNIPGNFALTSSTAPGSTPIGFEEALSSQYKEGSHYLPLQHSENPAMWLHGAGSRTMSTLPASTFYGFQGQQSQQNGGFRQLPQQSSHYGPMGYLNFYQSQGGPTQEQHQQNPSEGNLSGSQSSASHQIWQHGY